ncbi:YbaK/EbsC family protein [Emcibacter sp.]|uniref:aminoacyl-tRNA deacylase n=1 Tax=Emcibacter sp. TaxID=1979954 RepID=UPI002AA6878A|nr:YbaK/EbsC family protein [Emcibacter sp.]
MGMAISLRDYLRSMNTSYETLEHPHAVQSTYIASSAHIPGKKLAKGVLLASGSGYLLAVIPSDHRLDLHKVEHVIKEKVDMASEEEVEMIFNDCDPGAVPPVGQAYGLTVFLDDDLADCTDIYLEGGDHESLVHLEADDFLYVMQGAVYGDFSRTL